MQRGVFERAAHQARSESMTDVAREVDRYIEEHLPEFIADLGRLVAVPSVSSRGEHMEEAAGVVGELLTAAGFSARTLPTGGFPVVYADSGAGPARTLICYNHYDVQPPEPLELWESTPFTLTERDGRVYARGVSDDKGQLISRIAAMRAMRAVTGDLGARVKFLVEGEEEISSPNLEPFVEHNKDLLAADACVWEFGGVNHEGRPMVVLGLRGILYVEYHARTLSRDAHSGGAHNLPNAAWRLLRAMATLKDEDGRIRIPGFYDDARAPGEVELKLLEEMPSDEAFQREHYGVQEFVNGHSGIDYQRAVYEPTANIAGLSAGWEGKGSKTVIPAAAMAKMDFRLVPDQDPQDILAKLRRHLDQEGFGDVEVVLLGGERAGTTPPSDPFVQLTVKTAGQVYGKPPIVDPLVGGSGPMYAFRAHLGTPIVTLGPGDPRSNAHSPNESMSIDNFLLGTQHMARLLLGFAE
jgi:acetylornithine deacetylase/succinyl-diaminopimelate desuccinylase-like protein